LAVEVLDVAMLTWPCCEVGGGSQKEARGRSWRPGRTSSPTLILGLRWSTSGGVRRNRHRWRRILRQ